MDWIEVHITFSSLLDLETTDKTGVNVACQCNAAAPSSVSNNLWTTAFYAKTTECCPSPNRSQSGESWYAEESAELQWHPAKEHTNQRWHRQGQHWIIVYEVWRETRLYRTPCSEREAAEQGWNDSEDCQRC